MSKSNKILLVLVIALIVILAAVILWQKAGFERAYWAVYLNTGDMYFGKLVRCPKLSLSDVWFLQRNPQDTENPLSLAEFESVFWGPEDRIYVNKDSVVWKAKLRADSQVLQFIKNPQTAQSLPPSSQPETQSNEQAN